MAEKAMLEVTQSVVAGNEVAVHSGDLFEVGARLPEGVSVRPVLVDVPDAPRAEAKPEPAKAAAKAPVKS
jgi:hypothetical protein